MRWGKAKIDRREERREERREGGRECTHPIWESNVEIKAHARLPGTIELDAGVETRQGIGGVGEEDGFLGVGHVELVHSHLSHCTVLGKRGKRNRYKNLNTHPSLPPLPPSLPPSLPTYRNSSTQESGLSLDPQTLSP